MNLQIRPLTSNFYFEFNTLESHSKIVLTKVLAQVSTDDSRELGANMADRVSYC